MVPKYRRVLLKTSGKVLAGEQNYGIDRKIVSCLAEEIKEVIDLGVELALVIGGGNIIHGAKAVEKEIFYSRITADYIGMLATIINALALQDELEKKGIISRVLSSVEVQGLCEPYFRRSALRYLEKKQVVILAGGTGNPYFTTDTAAALRGSELKVDVILKATDVDGIYSSDPEKNKSAIKFDKLSYQEVLERNLKVMDIAAISLCMENRIPIIVFNLKKYGNIKKAILGEPIGTLVS